MKLFVLMLLTSISAFGAQTVIEHDYAGALKNIEISNACLTSTNVQTIQPQLACVEYKEVQVWDGDGGYYTEYRCVKTAKVHSSHSRIYKKSWCAEYKQVGGTESGYLECVRYEEKEMVLPQTIQVRVVTNYGDASNWPGIQKSFTFPACK